MSRFLISCGGTGGHLSPGIALAESLCARGHDVQLLISRKKVDSRLVEKYPHLRFARVAGTGFGWRPAQMLACATSQARAFAQCLAMIRRSRPDAVVGFGGFTSAPITLAAWISGVPAALHEANRVPGLAIRTLGRLARRVYLPPGVGLWTVGSSATRYAGLPVRREIVRQPRAGARAALGLDPERPVLAILGGSQGASALNDWARANLQALAEAGAQLYVVTGMGKGEEGVAETKTRDGATVRVVFTAFSDRMAELLSAADLVLSRAGAGTLAELARCETPAVLVPYPHAADDHQRANAAWFEREGGGIVVEQTQMGRLLGEVTALIADEARLRVLRENLRRMDRANAIELLRGDIEELAREGRPDWARRGGALVA